MTKQQDVAIRVAQWMSDAAEINGVDEVTAIGQRVSFRFDGMIVKVKVDAILDRGGNRIAGKTIGGDE